jgi:hypothetical protein
MRFTPASPHRRLAHFIAAIRAGTAGRQHAIATASTSPKIVRRIRAAPPGFPDEPGVPLWGLSAGMIPLRTQLSDELECRLRVEGTHFLNELGPVGSLSASLALGRKEHLRCSSETIGT